MKQRDKVRLTAAGLAANPELAEKSGVVESVSPGCVEVRFEEGKTIRWCWLKDIYLEKCEWPVSQ